MLKTEAELISQQLSSDIEAISQLEGVTVKCFDLASIPECKEDSFDSLQSVDRAVESSHCHYKRTIEIVVSIENCVCALRRGSKSRVILHVAVLGEYPLTKPTFTVFNVENAATRLFNVSNKIIRELRYKSLPKFIKCFCAKIRSEFAPPRHQQSVDSWVHVPQAVNIDAIDSIADNASSDRFQVNGVCKNAAMEPNVVARICGNRDPKDFHKYLMHTSRYYREFTFEKLLGNGAFGSVNKVRRGEGVYAVKQIPIYKEFGSHLYEEAAVLAQLKHRNVVQYIDAWLEDAIIPEEPTVDTSVKDEEDSDLQSELTQCSLDVPSMHGAFKSENVIENVKVIIEQRGMLIRQHNHSRRHYEYPIKYLYILMEYCNEYTLNDAIKCAKLYESPTLVLELIRQILEALNYIHEKGIVHRDIKPSNIFFKGDESLLIKVGDFGLTYKLNEPSKPQGNVGTMFYMAPETFSDFPYDEKVDIYSAGVVFFEMLSPPFETAMERAEILASFEFDDKIWPEGFKERVGPKIFSLLTSMLEIDPEVRPTASELLQNELFAVPKIDVNFIYRVITQFPFSSESTRLLNTLFCPKPPSEKDNLYFKDFLKDSSATSYVNFELANLYQEEFKLRGAVKVIVPPLVESDAYRSNTQKLLLNDGRICFLRSSLLGPLSELVPDALVIIMRRCCWDTVYNVHSDGLYPHESWHCAYDIVADYKILLPDGDANEGFLDVFFTSEIIATATRPMCNFISGNVCIDWGLKGFFHTILNQAYGLSGPIANQVLGVFKNFPKKGTSALLKSQLLHVFKEGNFENQLLEGLISLYDLTLDGKIRQLERFFGQLNQLLGTRIDIKKQVRAISFLESFLLDTRIVYCFDLYQNLEGFTKFTFVLSVDMGKGYCSKLHIGTGGCCNELLDVYGKNHILDHSISLQRNVFGFELNLDPLVEQYGKMEAAKSTKLTQVQMPLVAFNSYPNVVIYLSKVSHLMTALILEQRIHKMGLLCDKVYSDIAVAKRVRKLKELDNVKLIKVRYIIILKSGSNGHNVDTVQFKSIDLKNYEERVLTDIPSVLEFILPCSTSKS
ncbi:bifunctional Protein kinase domain/Protein kinase-like domain superfamily/Serine-threonine-protein kinase [Babesia duncani]|uniref:Bifunctional Protein kinase domain/Protein kinase-like domain superfamily/Serine-threonine-protein kinase n=1 Tax=Babesia duncani TaxID=323732 RepID=A0AAD9UMV5_9APIC|nr:bifunctional Protein kinase domain/Protein kinase-like domain superfamily/Serine-threonine-protein kinase [Babesia duncani]